jgi:hypothetical protein
MKIKTFLVQAGNEACQSIEANSWMEAEFTLQIGIHNLKFPPRAYILGELIETYEISELGSDWHADRSTG